MEPSRLNHDFFFIGPLQTMFPPWLDVTNYSDMLIIADSNTQRLCLPAFLEKTGLNPQTSVVVVAAGERQKNLSSCEKIWQAMLDAKLDRKSLVINLGGGVVGDMGGFCASTWKRGVDFVQVPTTLLAMTDAAIGGKLGVDFQGVKNILGVFRQPTAVFVDPDFLNTLPERELRSGFAEVIKHAIIGDPELWQLLLGTENLTEISTQQMFDILCASIVVKTRIVEEDPHEKNIRMLLNYGHTIGHALESYFLETEAPLLHGEAVAIGMICETQSQKRRDEIASLILRTFPHRHIPESAFPAIWELMLQDKKNASGKVRMALPDELPFSMKIVETTQAELERSLLYYNRLVAVGAPEP